MCLPSLKRLQHYENYAPHPKNIDIMNNTCIVHFVYNSNFKKICFKLFLKNLLLSISGHYALAFFKGMKEGENCLKETLLGVYKEVAA